MSVVLNTVTALEQLSWTLLQREDAPESVHCALRELRATLEQWLGGAAREADDHAPESIYVPSHGDWMRLPSGAHVDLRNRRAVRKLAHAIISARIARPGVPIEASELIGLVWPSADPTDQLVMKRLHVTISRLRRAGFEHVLITQSTPAGTGWLVNPNVRITLGRFDAPNVAESIRIPESKSATA